MEVPQVLLLIISGLFLVLGFCLALASRFDKDRMVRRMGAAVFFVGGLILCVIVMQKFDYVGTLLLVALVVLTLGIARTARRKTVRETPQPTSQVDSLESLFGAVTTSSVGWFGTDR